MNFWDTITGNDMTRELKVLDARAQQLPPDYQSAWEEIKVQFMPHSDFTGRNLMPLLDNSLGLLEEAAADGLSIQEVLGEDIPAFCAAMAGGEGARTYRDKWREQLNRNVARKLSRLGE